MHVDYLVVDYLIMEALTNMTIAPDKMERSQQDGFINDSTQYSEIISWPASVREFQCVFRTEELVNLIKTYEDLVDF